MPKILVSLTIAPFTNTPLGRTDDAGTIRRELPRARYRPQVDAHFNEGWSTSVAERFVYLNKPTTVELVVFPCASDVRVWVTNDVGVPVVGAVVTGWKHGSDVTDQDGAALMTDLPTGKIGRARVKSAPHEAHVSVKEPITSPLRELVSGMNELTLIVPRQAQLEVRLSPGALDRMTEATPVRAKAGDEWQDLTLRENETTLWIHPGTVTLSASASEPLRLAVPRSLQMDPGARHVWTIEHLGGDRSVHGEVVDITGRAVPSARIRVGFSSSDRQAAETKTDATGRFNFADLPEETFTVSLIPDHSTRFLAAPSGGKTQFVVPPDHDGAALQFVLEPSYAVRGSILRRGAIYSRPRTVVLIGPLGTSASTSRTTLSSPRATPGVERGQYFFGSVVAGNYRVHLEDNAGTGETVNVGPGLVDSAATVDLSVD